MEEQFGLRMGVWEESQRDIDILSGDITLSKKIDRKAAMNNLVRLSRDASNRMGEIVGIAVPLYKLDPAAKPVEAFLIKALGIYARRGRLEEAGAIGNVLVAHGVKDPQVDLIVGLGALEAFDVDSAKKYLESAAAAGPLPTRVEAALKQLDENRELFQHERTTRQREAEADDLPRVLLETSQGPIEIELYENEYPNAVASFLHLVENNFYNGTPFFQVTPGFGAIAGSLHDDGTGGPGYEIPLVPPETLPRIPTRGAVSLINMGDGACGSKFMLGYSWVSNSHLRRTQPVIGRIINGMSVAAELNWVEPRRPADDHYERDFVVRASIVRKRPHAYHLVTTTTLAGDQYNAGVELLQSGKVSEAEVKLAEALKIAPRDRQILDAMALALSQQERLADAARYLQRAIDVDPRLADSHFHLGKVWAAMDKLQDARRSLEETLRLKPDHVDARMDLADVYRREGKTDEAIAQYTECMKYQGNAELIRQRLQELSSKK